MRYTIQKMAPSDLDLAVEWAAREGWNPGLHDGTCYFQADPGGFHMGFLDGRPVASISLVRYGSRFAFLGFYIVVPECRGRGYGIKLWNHAMSLAKGRNVGLDGVASQQENYKKSGFKLAFRNIRFQGKAPAPVPDSPDILSLDQISPQEFLTYDTPFFPEDRTGFIRCWIARPGTVSLGLVMEKILEGYGVIRPCRKGYKIGPLFANTPEQAASLFHALASRADQGQPIYLDVPEPNARALELADQNAMSPCFETARMYTGSFPDMPLDRIYGITSFEVG